jgi:hypothetical protein
VIPIISQNTEGETIHEKIYFLSFAGSGSFRRHGSLRPIEMYRKAPCKQFSGIDFSFAENHLTYIKNAVSENGCHEYLLPERMDFVPVYAL